jgi:hypothetical protein
MGFATNNIDRLLPRHESPESLDLSWNVRVERSGLFKNKGEEISDRATIRDISLEGALIEITDSHHHEPGDEIAVRFRGLDGQAVIKHRRRADGSETLLYGVRFRPDAAFNDAIDEAVGEIRGHSSELNRVWQRQN